MDHHLPSWLATCATDHLNALDGTHDPESPQHRLLALRRDLEAIAAAVPQLGPPGASQARLELLAAIKSLSRARIHLHRAHTHITTGSGLPT